MRRRHCSKETFPERQKCVARQPKNVHASNRRHETRPGMTSPVTTQAQLGRKNTCSTRMLHKKHAYTHTYTLKALCVQANRSGQTSCYGNWHTKDPLLRKGMETLQLYIKNTRSAYTSMAAFQIQTCVGAHAWYSEPILPKPPLKPQSLWSPRRYDILLSIPRQPVSIPTGILATS